MKYNFPCGTCRAGDRYEPKPQTNADRIRAMTDEDLAGLLNGSVSPCPHPWYVRDNCHHFDDDCDCDLCWLNWLNQEVE